MSEPTLATADLMATTYTNGIIYSCCGLGLAWAAYTTNQILTMKMDPSKVKVQQLSEQEKQKLKEQNVLIAPKDDTEGMPEIGGPP
jgi:hypothetical protein